MMYQVLITDGQREQLANGKPVCVFFEVIVNLKENETREIKILLTPPRTVTESRAKRREFVCCNSSCTAWGWIQCAQPHKIPVCERHGDKLSCEHCGVVMQPFGCTCGRELEIDPERERAADDMARSTGLRSPMGGYYKAMRNERRYGMKWTEKLVRERAAEFAAIAGAEHKQMLREVRDDTIDECCRAVCVHCRNHAWHSVKACGAIRDHFRETT